MTPALRMNQARRRGALLVVIVLGVLSVWMVLDRYREPPRALEAARAFIDGLGWEGVVVYVAVFIAGSVLLVPATALSVIAPILFGAWLGFIAILIGNMAAAA